MVPELLEDSPMRSESMEPIAGKIIVDMALLLSGTLGCGATY